VEISEIRVKLVADPDDKLQAFCTITFDHEFVVRDLKIIRGPNGPFVAMPSRKLTDRCQSCSGKNHLRARYCNDCGRQLDPNRAGRDERGRAKLHTDIAHPIHAESRSRIQGKIIDAYRIEVEKSKLPGYKPPKLGADYDDGDEEFRAAPPPRHGTPPPDHERELEA
jgi:stage V sporulation protein G